MNHSFFPFFPHDPSSLTDSEDDEDDDATEIAQREIAHRGGVNRLRVRRCGGRGSESKKTGRRDGKERESRMRRNGTEIEEEEK